jgi:DNA polymerase III psi subunit
MARPSLVIVLIEDSRQQQLIFRYLRRNGLDTHAMRFLLPPSGSGEQWVREQLPKELREYRRRNARAKTKLIAVIDADISTVQDRLAQLDRKLQDDGVDLIRVAAEQVARLVPKRNIETWILCLNGITVGEQDEDDYKRTRNDWEYLIRPAANMLYEWTRPNAQIPEHCIPSLRHGVGELGRLDFSDV